MAIRRVDAHRHAHDGSDPAGRHSGKGDQRPDGVGVALAARHNSRPQRGGRHPVGCPRALSVRVADHALRTASVPDRPSRAWLARAVPAEQTLGQHLRYPTAVDLFAIWVIGFFSFVGYVPAVYMTYRYLLLYSGRRLPHRPGTLAGRLTELDAAHAAGLIGEDEHQLRRRALLDTF